MYLSPEFHAVRNLGEVGGGQALSTTYLRKTLEAGKTKSNGFDTAPGVLDTAFGAFDITSGVFDTSPGGFDTSPGGFDTASGVLGTRSINLQFTNTLTEIAMPWG